MPAKTYMQVDPRHDHAFRVPRPDESVRFGTSNACNDCHTDKDAAWAAAAVERWFGAARKGFQTWTETFAAASTGKIQAAALLLQLAASADAPSIARATAFESLALYPSRETLTAAERGLADADPLVRLAALRTLRPFPVEQSWPIASRLLADPVLGVRLEAASLLAAMPQDNLPAAGRERLSRAIDEYVKAQQVNADRPEHRLNLGNLYLKQHRFAEAEAEYAAARALDPGFTPVYVSLAQLYAQQGNDTEGERVLRKGLSLVRDDPELHHALGLNLVRQQRAVDALPELASAATNSSNPRYAYVYAIALNSAGHADAAITTLESSHARHPADRETMYALVTINRDLGRNAAALAWAARLATIDPSAKLLVEQLRQTPPSR
jgi:tetratricopeptide (TPR) repeat protein